MSLIKQHIHPRTMQFQITSIEFDFTGSEDEITSAEMNDIIDDTVGHIWSADDEDDLIEEITAWTGWCIKSLDYRHVLV